jgi:hypothetical protein
MFKLSENIAQTGDKPAEGKPAPAGAPETAPAPEAKPVDQVI